MTYVRELPGDPTATRAPAIASLARPGRGLRAGLLALSSGVVFFAALAACVPARVPGAYARDPPRAASYDAALRELICRDFPERCPASAVARAGAASSGARWDEVQPCRFFVAAPAPRRDARPRVRADAHVRLATAPGEAAQALLAQGRLFEACWVPAVLARVRRATR